MRLALSTIEIITYFVIAGFIGIGWLYIAAIVTNKKDDDYDWWNDV